MNAPKDPTARRKGRRRAQRSAIACSGAGLLVMAALGGTAAAAVPAASTVPGAPVDPTISVVSSSALEIAWGTPASGGSTLTSYDISLYVNGSAYKNYSSKAPSNAQELTGLPAGTSYFVYMYAYNADGHSVPSARSNTVGVPGAASDITLTPSGTSSIGATWTPPADNGTPLTGYSVNLYADGSFVQGFGEPGTATSATLSGISNFNPADQYFVYIYTYNAFGHGGPSDRSNTITFTSPVRTDIVNLADSYNGKTYGPGYTNPFGPSEEWCALFVEYIWQKEGIDIPQNGYSGAVYDWAAGQDPSQALPATATPQLGDAVLFGSNGAYPDSKHVAIVVAINSNGTITTVNGDDGQNPDGVNEATFTPSQAVAEGEPGPVYGYASPIPLDSTAAAATSTSVTLPQYTPAQIDAAQDTAPIPSAP
jgi:hypothetical protein